MSVTEQNARDPYSVPSRNKSEGRTRSTTNDVLHETDIPSAVSTARLIQDGASSSRSFSPSLSLSRLLYPSRSSILLRLDQWQCRYSLLSIPSSLL